MHVFLHYLDFVYRYLLNTGRAVSRTTSPLPPLSFANAAGLRRATRHGSYGGAACADPGETGGRLTAKEAETNPGPFGAGNGNVSGGPTCLH